MKSILYIYFLFAGLISFGQYYPSDIQVPDTAVYYVCDENPEFPGGEFELMKFLKDSLQYPIDGPCIQGVVYATFIIERNGSITNIRCVRGLSEDADKECIKVIKKMPKWKPGKVKGFEVRTQFTIPIRFGV